ncbi:MAG: hypothetical protein Q3965_05910, partial [Rothia sp. (in: high G+C Gram-positive bacteria)]|nr:hypothetical protein [Rothia sp. (in: high G+C Gram-positive bacteria)]
APDSDLYRSDTALLGSDTAGQLKGTKIQLSTVESLEQTDTGVKATITVEAHGYQPQGSEAELATAGIVKDGDRVFQNVGICAHKTQVGRLLLETAEPIASGKQ